MEHKLIKNIERLNTINSRTFFAHFNFLFPEDFYKFDREKMKNASVELVRRKHRTELGV